MRIVEESFSGPRLASATARRHGLSNQQLFAWRKAYREGCLGELGGLVPAVIVAERAKTISAPDGGRIEIVTANERRVIVDRDVDVEALLRIAGSQRGADRAAVMLTLITTARLNDIDPKAWLADVLARSPICPSRACQNCCRGSGNACARPAQSAISKPPELQPTSS